MIAPENTEALSEPAIADRINHWLKTPAGLLYIVRTHPNTDLKEFRAVWECAFLWAWAEVPF